MSWEFHYDEIIDNVTNDDGVISPVVVGEMLVLDAIPTQISGRYGYIPTNLYIRRCYIELYEHAVNILLGNTGDKSGILFTGVPGIGSPFS